MIASGKLTTHEENKQQLFDAPTSITNNGASGGSLKLNVYGGQFTFNDSKKCHRFAGSSVRDVGCDNDAKVPSILRGFSRCIKEWAVDLGGIQYCRLNPFTIIAVANRSCWCTGLLQVEVQYLWTSMEPHGGVRAQRLIIRSYWSGLLAGLIVV